MKSSRWRHTIVVIACALVAYAAPAGATGSLAVDPCTLLTANQVQAVLGVPFNAGAPISKTSCQ